MNGRAFPDLEYRFGAFADIGPEAEMSVYFKTAAEAEAYARGYWAALSEEARRGTDVYSGEINIHAVNGRLGWSEVAITYDAKAEERA